ncbi:MAG: virulence-associated protein vagC [Gammaproteobacteria bacterium]|nr:virulence-associated protein vagC [Gammaproteobacteria bacterium]
MDRCASDSLPEVTVCRERESVLLTSRLADWSGFFASPVKASPDFMAEREDLPIQERSFGR